MKLLALFLSAISLSACVASVSTSPSAPAQQTVVKETVVLQTVTTRQDRRYLPRCLKFPDAPDGRKILTTDLHTHSVFSDGNVWPTIRVEESVKDCLFAMAVTEHLEWQPHIDDIPHPDRNRSFQVAKEHVDRRFMPLTLIPGAEITRFFPPGHLNAIFIEDANPILYKRGPRRGEPLIEESIKAIDAAEAQDAFIFWNHPAWAPDFPSGVMMINDFHLKMIAEDKLDGIEVANGQYYSEEAFQTALDHDLAILGTSDIHGLIDWDYDIANGGHRTTTLVLAEDESYDALEKAIRAKQTVALYEQQLIGRDEQLQPVLKALITMEKGQYRRRSTILTVVLRNAAPFDMHLRNVGDNRFSNAGDVITVPAHGVLALSVTDVPSIDDLEMRFEVLSAYKAPGIHPVIELR